MPENKKNNITSWLLLLLKGVFIGSGFILPGVSGGALAAVFGLYERLILFMANITKDFKENFLFFLPVGIGGVLGILVFAVFLNFFFEIAEVQVTWFFIGCIIGTLPTLWRQAGREGRKVSYIVALITSLAAAFFFLIYIESAVGGGFPLNIYTWTLAGAIIAFGVVVPGLSSSSLLLFLGMYAPMTGAIASFDFSVIIPIGIGGLATVFAFSRLMAFVFDRAYGLLFHVIIRFVVASTLLIIPLDYDYLGLSGVLCVGAAVIGICLALWMCKLEEFKEM